MSRPDRATSSDEQDARPTYAQAVAAAGHALAVALVEQAARTPHEAATAAWCPGGPSVDELERRIRVERGLPAVPDASDNAAGVDADDSEQGAA